MAIGGNSPLSVGSFAYNPTPMGLGMGIAGAVLGSMFGNRGEKFTTTYNNGQYGLNSSLTGYRPVDTSKYKITGSQGTYDLMPYLQKMQTGESESEKARKAFLGIPSNPSLDAYNSIIKAMGNDTQAVNNFKKMYPQVDAFKNSGINYSDPTRNTVDFGLSREYDKFSGASPSDVARVAQGTRITNNPFLMPSSPFGRSPMVQSTPVNGLLARQIAAAGGTGKQALPAYAGLQQQIAAARR